MEQDVGRIVERAGNKSRAGTPSASRSSCARRRTPEVEFISNQVPHTFCPYSQDSGERLDTKSIFSLAIHCSGLHVLCKAVLTPKQVPTGGERWQQRALHICCCQTQQPCAHAPDRGQAEGAGAGKREVQKRVGFGFSILGVGVGVKLKPHGTIQV